MTEKGFQTYSKFPINLTNNRRKNVSLISRFCLSIKVKQLYLTEDRRDPKFTLEE